MPSVKKLIAEAKRFGHPTLNLSRMNLTALPDGIRELDRLTDLDVGVNSLSRLPDWIGELRGLRRLNLFQNRITSLPESIGELGHLTELNLGHNQLTSLPATIGNLASLIRLDLDINRITALPGSIGRLERLVKLSIFHNDLTDLPASIARLRDLTWLDAADNRFGTFPEPVTELTGLTRLEMTRTRLTDLPDSIGRLVNLVHLGLDFNRLTRLPRTITALTNLSRLNLNGNKFNELPEYISGLTGLSRLDAENNGLRSLPRSILKLGRLEQLYLEGNLLPPEQRAAAESGLPALREFMEGLDTGSADFREAKLVLVGEGEVGKSSLLAAMRGEPFDPHRGSTHGVEVKTLELTGPGGEPSSAITMNAWDFGGQKAYRPSHQLFFTAPAVYVVVWKARLGSMQGFVDYWIDLIRRRTSDEHIRIHIVATHVDGQHPKIDQASLMQRYDDVIGGFHFVDSRTGLGIDDLRAALWDSAAAIPQINREVPAGWRNLRRSLIQSGESYLEYDDYLRRAEAHGLDEDAARALATIATQLGYWIHYPRINGLKEIVVLKGDWLSKAVSLVVDDAETASRHGLVEHRRLSRLWNDPGNGPDFRYDPKFHPALIQLMEKYDLSYRIAESEGRPPSSLIAQLVDEVAPPLHRAWDEFGPHLKEDSQLCEFLDTRGAKGIPEGLLHQLIVRWHRHSLGRERFEDSVHWHSGFVIQPSRYTRVMVRLEEQRLRVTVKAAYPELFLETFIQDLEDYVGEHWPGFRVKRLVPCAGECLDPERSGTGLFGLERLLTRRSLGKKTAECRRCWADMPIDRLIHRPPDGEDEEPAGGPPVPRGRRELGLGVAERGEAEQLERIEEEIQKLITLFTDEAVNGPRFYTVELRDRESWSRRLTHTGVRVVLWCEHSRLPLYVLDDDPRSGVFEIDVPRDWLVRSAPWISRTLKVLWSTVLPGGSVAMDLLVPSFDPAVIENHLELAEESFKIVTEIGEKAIAGAERQPAWGVGDGQSGAQLRRLHAFLDDADPGFGGLERVQDRGKFLWVHPDFVSEYEPGTPSFA
ncbi:COR domain-containing protein [Glycomyces harbinensis]|uniref:non-specific serine/threonine protein kinase n=1 Tax=Glycomyces harbinensis TaxID=58114 RepID=A0A1G6SQ91_9ACTN|nr:COR domain-containing protein [Glycomyces harbinensis]SDD18983.1 Leucine rich repeat-containing protein [Glycomyces harbinensis]